MFRIKHAFVLLVILTTLYLFVFYQTHIEPNTIPQIDIKRTVYVKVVVDKLFRDNPRWERLIQDLIKKGSYHFNCQLGIEIVFKKIEDVETPVTINDMPVVKAIDPYGVMAMAYHLCNLVGAEVEVDWLLENINFEDCDIVVYFTGKNYGLSKGCVTSGSSGNCALVAYKGTKNGFQEMLDVLVHELGHLFGAEHVKDEHSVMYFGSLKSLEFDKGNRKTILENKWRDLKQQPEEK